MRILLAEDDRMIGEAVVVGLKDAAYAVDWVRDGAMATRAAASETYDCILLDLGLPKRDGLDVLADIRRDSAAPILILTAVTTSTAACAASTAVRMITSSNPSTWRSCWRGCAPCCAAAAAAPTACWITASSA